MTLDRAKERERQIKAHMNMCRHFNGVMNEKCKAGVSYEQFRGEGIRNFPCFADEGKGASCPSASFHTRQEAEAHEEETQKRIAEMLRQITEHECTTCGTKNITHRQVGHCVYSVECGHRQYQGKADTK